MLRSSEEIKGYTLRAEDGEIGCCKDFYFNDEIWTIRYMVADTNKWLPGKKVLISPIALGDPDWASRIISVHLQKKQIEQAPDLSEHVPVSRQYEIKYFEYYGWPSYWEGPGGSGPHGYPARPYSKKQKTIVQVEPDKGDPHLRSSGEVTGYRIIAKDGEVGHVEDFIIEDQSWIIRYIVVDTQNWVPASRKVLISPKWVDSIDWENSKVTLDLSIKEIKECPKYDPSTPVNREYETRLYDFYGRPKYWS